MDVIAKHRDRTAFRGLLAAAARWWAVAGGCVLLAMATVTSLSVLGRAIDVPGLSQIRGDFELVELGCAIAVFSFLPWCQVNRGHVRVDVLARLLPGPLFVRLGWLGDLALTLCSAVIAWRIWLGFGERFPYGSEALRAALHLGAPPFYPETTYELQIPLWSPYLLAVIGALLFFLVCLHDTLSGRALHERDEEELEQGQGGS